MALTSDITKMERDWTWIKHRFELLSKLDRLPSQAYKDRFTPQIAWPTAAILDEVDTRDPKSRLLIDGQCISTTNNKQILKGKWFLRGGLVGKDIESAIKDAVQLLDDMPKASIEPKVDSDTDIDRWLWFIVTTDSISDKKPVVYDSERNAFKTCEHGYWVRNLPMSSVNACNAALHILYMQKHMPPKVTILGWIKSVYAHFRRHS